MLINEKEWGNKSKHTLSLYGWRIGWNETSILNSVTSTHSHTVSSLYNDFYKIISDFDFSLLSNLYNTQILLLISICPFRSLFLFKK